MYINSENEFDFFLFVFLSCRVDKPCDFSSFFLASAAQIQTYKPLNKSCYLVISWRMLTKLGEGYKKFCKTHNV